MNTENLMEQIIPQLPVEPVITLALRGDRAAIARVIDLEVDYYGRHVGFAEAAAIWLRVERELAA